MEPRIQYAQTGDGVSIAYWTLGEGTPLVYMPPFPFSHIQLEWQNPERRRWYQCLAEKRKVIGYDVRGTGLSERNIVNYSMNTHILDMEAVVNRLQLERFALFAFLHAGPVAITYATQQPERVSHLILWCTYARASDYSQSPQAQGVRALIDTDWETYTETVGHLLFAWSEGEQGSHYAELMRESATQTTTQAYLRAVDEFDVSPLLPNVSSPTLVLHRRHLRWPSLEVATALVARIPDARLALLEGTSAALHMGDTEAVLRAIDDFLGHDEEAAATAEESAPGAFRTILFTDVEGSTALTQRLGDAKAREVLREHERITREVLKAHGGAEVKTMGDGFMASFSSVTRAVECAIALQRAFAERNESAGEPLDIRVGLNAGEPIEEEGDLFGAMVILAARIAARAQGGEILASLAVRELCAGKGFLFADTGEVTLKGFEEPIRLYEVAWRD